MIGFALFLDLPAPVRKPVVNREPGRELVLVVLSRWVGIGLFQDQLHDARDDERAGQEDAASHDTLEGLGQNVAFG